ncbi:MAG: deoxynucleoside kinase [Candidatus Marinimicrobia bacterium]|nr:deoxynucleoside kinase [Candidatus Neomarinimicrobiota bacterium]MDP7528564.1 deoxynucleoside kinase [Candidatus Neomarinimicrobiota bacterium]
MSDVPFVGIAGNIAVGKTTLTKMISERLGWRPFFESVDDNPYLSDFYSDMKRWSFHLQIYFLSRRFRTHREMSEGDVPAVQDRTIYEDVEIFAQSLHEMGNMPQRDWVNYRALFDEMTSYLRKPTLIIFLKATTDSLLTRLKKRGREYEKSVSAEYLHNLNIAYARWINRAKLEFNVMTVDTDNFDVYKDKDRLEQLIQDVAQRCEA